MPVIYRYSQSRDRHNVKPNFRIHKIMLLFLLFVLLALFISIQLLWITAKGTPKLYNLSNIELGSDTELVWPDNGQASVGTFGAGIIKSKPQPQKSAPIASMAKVITALAILDKHPLQLGDKGPTITFDTIDEQIYRDYLSKNGSVTAVTAGKSMSYYEALQAMLLPSSNNMTDSLVRRVFGSIDNYVIYANKMIDNFGLTNTHIFDASGFSSKTTSTPDDMISIGQKALSNPVITEIMSQSSANIPLAGHIENFNHLLGVDNVTGGKTGNTDEAGWCLLSIIQKSPKEDSVISVIMGMNTPNELYLSARKLLASTSELFRDIKLVNNGDIVGDYFVPWLNKSIKLVAKKDLIIKHQQIKKLGSSRVITDSNPPFRKGQEIGIITFTNNPTLKVPIAVAEEIPPPTLFWRARTILSFYEPSYR